MIVLHLTVDMEKEEICPKLEFFRGGACAERIARWEAKGYLERKYFYINISIWALLNSYCIALSNHGKYSAVFNNCQHFSNVFEQFMRNQANQMFPGNDNNYQSNQHILSHHRAGSVMTSLANHRGFEDTLNVIQKSHGNGLIDYIRHKIIRRNDISATRIILTLSTLLGMVYCIWTGSGWWFIKCLVVFVIISFI